MIYISAGYARRAVVPSGGIPIGPAACWAAGLRVAASSWRDHDYTARDWV